MRLAPSRGGVLAIARGRAADPAQDAGEGPRSAGVTANCGRPRRGAVWNILGGDIDDCTRRSALLDRLCDEVGREPASITRSFHLPLAYDRPATARTAIAAALDAGFSHIVLGLPAPYSDGVVRWVADELITRG